MVLVLAFPVEAQYTESIFQTTISGTPATADTAYVPHIFSVEDSLIRKANYTPYVAGYALNDSTTSNPKVLIFNLPQSGWEGQVTDLFATSDSANTKTLRITFYNDTTLCPRSMDGVAIPYKAGNLSRRIGSIDITISGNTASAAGAGQTTFAGMTFAALLGAKMFGIVEVLSPYTPQKLEHYYFKIKGILKRPLP